MMSSSSGEAQQIQAKLQLPPVRPGDDDPLLNLSFVRARMDSLHQFLSDSVNSNTLIGKHQMDMVSAEISSAIRNVIVNGAALLVRSQNPNLMASPIPVASNSPDLPVVETPGISDMKVSKDNADDNRETEMKLEGVKDDAPIGDWEIIELDSVELLAEHSHFCDICGKGFKRDANLRMHMRAHGNRFKTLEALAKPEKSAAEPDHRNTRFSCPYAGCSRNKNHKKFRPLKSAICVKNHFRRSHCPKMYSCNRCNKKSFSVLADLRSHLKNCGKTRWKCTCGTTFSRKDKLFGHMALFEGHMPMVEEEEGVMEKGKGLSSAVMIEDVDEEDESRDKEDEAGANSVNCGFLNGLLDDGFGSIDGYNLEDVLAMGSTSCSLDTMKEFANV